MTIKQITNDDEFGVRLHKALSVSHPVRSIEYLKGRDDELERVRRALLAPGRHVFIFGERGVGKSSLGQTAATQYQSSDAEPILVSGSSDATFSSLVAEIACRSLERSRIESARTTSSIEFKWGGLRIARGLEISPLNLSDQIRSVGDAVQLLTQVARIHSDRPIVVVDEFDSVGSREERSKFATFLKQLGDQSVALKFVFTGVGTTLDELLGSHQSAYRQLETIELDRLGWDARREIAYKAVEAFGLHLDYDVSWRIAAISDGFPYFVHLIVEKMLWEAQVEEQVVEELEGKHYRAGLLAAIQGIAAELRRPYEKAVLHRSVQLEDVVWATADGEDLFRGLPQLFDSYKAVCRKRERESVLDRSAFAENLRKLKQPGFGAILTSLEGRQGWYTYREKMLRGYVRMQAEASGVELSGEREAPKQHAHVPVSARSGYRGPSVPSGVRLRGERRDR